ncbi:hypothetical protein BGZ82_009628 [Podila clonocystis]|nr:hypothetical protein BGZ82_009628 [Podila clonocystis]
MNSRHSRGPSDGEGLSMGPGGLNLNLARATPIKPQLGMPPMTREGKESRDQAQAWDQSLNRIFQTMQGEDTAKYLNYFKARLEIEDTYTRALEKLAVPGKGTKGSGININNNATTGSTGVPDPEDIPTTLQLAFDALLETTQQAFLRRRPFVSLIRNLIGALTGLKEAQEKQRKIQKETARPVFQLYAETRLSTVPKLKRAYEQRCRDVEQVLAMEDSDHLPVRERLKNMANSSGAAGRLVKYAEYKTAVHSLEAFRQQREKCFDTAYKVMQNIIKERGAKCRQCLEAFVVGERDLNARASADVDRFSIVVDCIKPAGDMDQLCTSFTKDVNSHPKAVYYENYYTKNVPESVFGTHLADYVRRYRNPIPLVIVKCADAIDRSGLRREGIYRVSGRHAQIMNLKKLFELNEETVDLTDPTYSEDVASIAAVLKIYLRELPEPLFPFPLNERSTYSANQDPSARLHELKFRLKRLPDCNIDTLQYLIQHLRRIYENVEYNKMSLENLSMIFTPAVFHDFNSAIAGPQPPAQQPTQHISPESSTSSLMALSFAGQGGASSPSSPSATAPWTSYPLPPSDQHPLQGSVQSLQQERAAGTSPMAIPERATQAGLSPSLQGVNSSATAALSTSPSNLGSSISPTHSSFNPINSNTVSTAASWTNDLVMSDLILNSHSIFDVLPKLPNRTQSMMIADEQEQRMLNAAMANTKLRVDSSHGNVPPPSVRQFNNTRKGSGSSSGGAPSSPIDGGHLRRPEPRFDSLGPHSGRQATRSSEADMYQQYQQLQNQPYQLPPSPSRTQGATPPSQPANQLYGQLHDVAQGGRSNNSTPPPSARAAQRSKSNVDLHQQYQHYQQLEQQYQPQTQYRPSPQPSQQQQQTSPQPQWMRENHGHKEEMASAPSPVPSDQQSQRESNRE